MHDVDISVCGANGGCMTTITGQGFGNDSSQLDIAFGHARCLTRNVTDTKILCVIGNTGKEYIVDNNGIHRGIVKLYIV